MKALRSWRRGGPGHVAYDHGAWGVDARPRIVAMTANAMQRDREECFAAGMDDDVTKPVRVDQLVDPLLRTPPRKDVHVA